MGSGCETGANRRKYIYERVMEHIAALIDSGDIRQGGKLPPERSMAELFRVSRSAVREAIRALAEQGIVESRQGDGTYVIAPPDITVAEHLARVMAGRRLQLEQVLQFRLALEPEIAALAAKNATSEDITALEDCIARQRPADVADAAKEDLAFHTLLARATGNPLFSEVLGSVRERLAETRDESLQSPERRRASLAAHRAILDTVQTRDPEAARTAMHDHLRRVADMLADGALDE